MYNPNTLGKFLRNKRLSLGLTGVELSELTGLNQANISLIELGKLQSPTMYNLDKLAKFYEMEPIELVKMIDNPNYKTHLYLKQYEDSKVE